MGQEERAALLGALPIAMHMSAARARLGKCAHIPDDPRRVPLTGGGTSAVPSDALGSGYWGWALVTSALTHRAITFVGTLLAILGWWRDRMNRGSSMA